jgi:Icc-related predicted phosphoesterase
MKIACVSDCHGKLHKANLPKADVLIIAGDYCPNFSSDPKHDAAYQFTWLKDFLAWLNTLSYDKIVIVAGNHDWVHFYYDDIIMPSKVIYLEDSQIEINSKLFYGSPWQPWFYDWAFNFPKDDKGRKAIQIWSKIPDKTDVLITHGPPFGVRDIVDRNGSGQHVGCPKLCKRVNIVKPKLHVFGHIHSGYGTTYSMDKSPSVNGPNGPMTIFVNASLCNEMYEPINPIQVINVE